MNWTRTIEEPPPLNKKLWVFDEHGVQATTFHAITWRDNKTFKRYLEDRKLTHWQLFIEPLPPI